jgi:hypothetical protein
MKSRSARPFVVSIIGYCLFLIGCTNTHPAPSSDPTPPVLTWVAHNDNTGDSFTISGSGQVTGSVNDTFSITLKAEDPEGVKLIQMSGSTSLICRGGPPEFPQTVTSGIVPQQSESFSPDAAGHVLTLAFLLQSVVPETNCPSPSTTLRSYQVLLNGLGSNYFAGNGEGQLAITFNP